MTYGGKLDDGYITQGGYAYIKRAHERFVVAIPESLPTAEAAPLLCAGITTYAPLKYAQTGKGKKVGIIGIGGLGHLAIKYAGAMGAKVVALSSSPSKEQESKRLGADEFLSHQEEEAMKKHAGTFDVLLNTTSADLDYAAFMSLLKPHGTFATVGAPVTEIHFPAFPLLSKNLCVTGNMMGSPREIAEMLEFSAQHKILPEIQLLPLEKANEALNMLKEKKVRYRCVLNIDPASAQSS